jgi:hypothetical protein
VDFEAGRLVPGGHAEWRAASSSLQVDVGYGLTSRLSVIASVPMGRRTLEHHQPDPGGPLSHDHSGGSFLREETATTGVGDVQLTTRLLLGRAWTVGAAVKLASGSHTRRDRFGRIADPMQQPGTGAPAGLATLQYSGVALPFGVSGMVAASYERALENDLGYRMGDEAILSVRGSRQILRGLAASAQLKAWRGLRNVYRGQASPSTGGTAFSIAPGLRWATPRGVGLYGTVQVPVYQRVNEAQLGNGLVALLGATRSF